VKIVRNLLILVMVALVAWLALRKQLAYAKIVTGISHVQHFLVPVDPASLVALSSAAAAGLTLQQARITPEFVYVKVTVEERALNARAAYTEKEAPEGAVVAMSPMTFLLSAAADAKADGVAINPGVPGAPLSAALDKETTLRVIESLKKRGFTAGD